MIFQVSQNALVSPVFTRPIVVVINNGQTNLCAWPGYTRNRKTVSDHDCDGLKNARYRSLLCPPPYPKLRTLVEAIIDIVLNKEERRMAETQDNAASFEEAVGKMASNLLIGHEVKDAA